MVRNIGWICALTVWAAPGFDARGASQATAPEDETAYAVGVEAGSYILERIEADGVTLDLGSLLSGVRDALEGREARIDEPRRRFLLQRLEQEVRQREAERLMASDPVFRALAEENLRRSRAFHDRFASEDGVVTLENGLQYRVIAPGEGDPPAANDAVIVTFEGRLLDGVEFADGDHARFIVGELNRGAREALTRMRPGARWIVAIPPDLAFGLAGRAPDVGPNESVVFEVELHSVEETRE